MYHGGVYDTVAAIQALPVSAAPSLAYCLANGLTYAYHPAPATSFGVLPAANGVDFLSTANGGDTRWIAHSYSGTYSETISNTSNLDSTPTTPRDPWFTRVGRLVRINLRFDGVDPTAAGTTSFRFTLPYTLSANFAAAYDLSGLCGNNNAVNLAEVQAVTGAKTGVVVWTANHTNSRSYTGLCEFLLI